MQDLLVLLKIQEMNHPVFRDLKVKRGEFLQWSKPGEGKVESDPVPAGKVWLVRAGGVATEDNTGAEYMMEIVLPANGWRVPVARTEGVRFGTPVLNLPYPQTLHEGEKLTARANGVEPPYKFALVFAYYEFDKSVFGL
jgi:hypothetical protein